MSSIETKNPVLVIVESPAKCKTIAGYLPKNYEVTATYGHIQSLKKDNNSVLPEQNFKMTWEYNNPARVKEIVGKAEKVSRAGGMIILATDPDREGEGISCHVHKAIISKVSCPIKRAVFNEISKKKILEALANPTEINQAKVDSYFARIALDYLVGFNLSPILWKKLKGCKSAGRVQSAVLRAIIDRQIEILNFKPQKYWTLTAIFKIDEKKYTADLHQWMGKPLEKFMWTSEAATEAAKSLMLDAYKISKIEKKEATKSPYPPFTTSTMQQEAASRYGWAPAKTSSIAQNLYEGIKVGKKQMGLVTYIRTDSVRMADDALMACKGVIVDRYGSKFSELRRYTSKAKNLQDGHEAIRPTDFSLLPWELEIDSEQKALYDLIWRRAMASQMAPAVYNITNVYLEGSEGVWKIHGREQIFKGFLEVYRQEDVEDEVLEINPSSALNIIDSKVNEHITQPKPQYTEASLIKYMDEVGIGRPSTYAYTLKVLETREYITKENKKIAPTKKGWCVTGLLDEYCKEYIQDGFTATIEEQLDLIAEGECEWLKFASDFWSNFLKTIDPIHKVNSKDVIDAISNKYSTYFFGDERQCPQCGKNKILVVLSNAQFVSCSDYENCSWKTGNSDQVVGQDLNTGEDILLKSGQHGPYLHWKSESKNVSVPPALLKNMNLTLAMQLKKLPMLLGTHPTTKEEVKLCIGQYGPYIKCGNVFASCKNIDSMDLETALDLVAKKSLAKPSKTYTRKSPFKTSKTTKSPTKSIKSVKTTTRRNLRSRAT